MGSDICKICMLGRQAHTDAEKAGEVHHKFSLTGEVVRVDEEPKPIDKDPAIKPAGLPSDPILRFLLISKGIVTADELEDAEKSLRATGMIST